MAGVPALPLPPDCCCCGGGGVNLGAVKKGPGRCDAAAAAGDDDDACCVLADASVQGRCDTARPGLMIMSLPGTACCCCCLAGGAAATGAPAGAADALMSWGSDPPGTCTSAGPALPSAGRCCAPPTLRLRTATRCMDSTCCRGASASRGAAAASPAGTIGHAASLLAEQLHAYESHAPRLLICAVGSVLFRSVRPNDEQQNLAARRRCLR